MRPYVPRSGTFGFGTAAQHYLACVEVDDLLRWVRIAIDEFVNLAIAFLNVEHRLLEPVGEFEKERFEGIVAGHLLQLVVGEPSLFELIKNQSITIVEIHERSVSFVASAIATCAWPQRR
jgi:hypothetical protein